MKGSTKGGFRRVALWASLMVWVGLVGLVGAKAIKWDFTCGPMTTVTARLIDKANRLDIVLVANPYCPCTKASIDSLRELVVRSKGGLHPTVLFVKLDSTEDSPNVHAATEIPDVTVRWVTSKTAETFGALTSGHVALFRGGHPIFSGGLTPSRGDRGPSQGMDAVLKAMEGKDPVASAPVFGCALSSDTRALDGEAQ